jgi:hypothetical protein
MANYVAPAGNSSEAPPTKGQCRAADREEYRELSDPHGNTPFRRISGLPHMAKVSLDKPQQRSYIRDHLLALSLIEC